MLFDLLRTPLQYLSLLAFSLLLCANDKRKPQYPFRLVLTASLCAIIGYLMNGLYPLSFGAGIFDILFILYYLCILALSAASIMILYRLSFRKVLFTTVSAHILASLCSQIRDIFRVCGFVHPVSSSFWELLAVYLASFSLVCIVFYFTGLKRLRYGYVETEHKGKIVFSIVVSLWLLVFGRFASRLAYEPVSTLIVSIQGIVCNVLLLIIQFYMLESARQSNQIRNFSMMMKKSAIQRRKELSVDQELKLLAHDMKNRALAYRASEAIQAVERFDIRIDSGNRYLDILLEEKAAWCKHSGIQMSVIADGKLLNFMDPFDLCALFGNALDNAIEACQSTDTKSISFVVQLRREMISVHIENSMAPGSGQLYADGQFPKTTKTDKENHGFGMTSINSITEQYGGVFTFQAHTDRFIMNFLFPAESSHTDTK